MSSRKDETRVCGYIWSEFIYWAFCRTLMRTEYFLFVYYTTSILAKLSTWCFEHSDDISCSLIVDLSHTDEFWEGWNTCLWIYIYIYMLHIYDEIYMIRYICSEFIHWALWKHWWEQNIFCLPHHKQFGKA